MPRIHIEDREALPSLSFLTHTEATPSERGSPYNALGRNLRQLAV